MFNVISSTNTAKNEARKETDVRMKAVLIFLR